MDGNLIRWELIVVILIIIGTSLLTSLFWKMLVDAWRIRWIYLEHQLAKAEDRKPRVISEVFSYFSLDESEKEKL